jgi:hypothetical protein
VQDNDVLPASPDPRGSLSSSSSSFIVPSVVNARSASGDTSFVSRVRLSNASPEAVQADLVFTPAGADGFDASAVRRFRLTVPGNDVVTLTDPLVSVLGLSPPAVGQLEVRADPARLEQLTVSSAVDAASSSGGSFGFQLPTARRGEGATLSERHVLSGVFATSALRTNLILAETTGLDHAAVRAVLYDQDGLRKGEALLDVPRYGQLQLSVTALGATSDLATGQIELTVESGGGAVLGLVTVIDNANGDASTFVARPLDEAAAPLAPRFLSRRPAWTKAAGTRAYVIPAVVNGYPTYPGTDQLYTFQSSMTFTSQTASAKVFRLRYLDKNTGQVVARTVTAPARASKYHDNVLEELFGLPRGERSQGPIFVEADLGGTITCKVFSRVQNGTIGDAFPIVPVPSESLAGPEGAASVYVDGLEQSVDRSRGTRSNLILNEVTGLAGATVTVRLYEAGNRTSPIAEKEVYVEAGDKVQLSDVFQGLDLDTEQRRKDRTNVLCAVSATSGAGLVSAVVTTIDNKTGDTRNALLTPTGGQPATGSGVRIGR